MKTLQECKDEVAKKHGYVHSDKLMSQVFFQNVTSEFAMKIYDEASELYAQSLKEDNERLKKEVGLDNEILVGNRNRISELESDLSIAKELLSKIIKDDLPRIVKRPLIEEIKHFLKSSPTVNKLTISEIEEIAKKYWLEKRIGGVEPTLSDMFVAGYKVHEEGDNYFKINE